MLTQLFYPGHRYLKFFAPQRAAGQTHEPLYDPLKAGTSGPEAGAGPGLYKRQDLPHALPFLLIAHAAGLGQPSFLSFLLFFSAFLVKAVSSLVLPRLSHCPPPPLPLFLATSLFFLSTTSGHGPSFFPSTSFASLATSPPFFKCSQEWTAAAHAILHSPTPRTRPS